MTKTVNPILSLAVVMALALAAVFGAMSLAGTAQASVNQSSGAELSERTFNPQAAPTSFSAKAVRGTGGGTIMLSWADQSHDGTDDDTDNPTNIDVDTWEVRWRQGDDAPTAAAWRSTEGSVNPDGTQLEVTDVDAEPDVVTTVTATVSGLADDTLYHFQVRGGGTSATPSVWKSATPMDPPGLVDDLAISVEGRDVTLNWDADSDASGWQVAYYTADEATEKAGGDSSATETDDIETRPAISVVSGDSDEISPAYQGRPRLPVDTTLPVTQTMINAYPAVTWKTVTPTGGAILSHTIEDLKSGEIYHFWVRGVAGDVRGEVGTTSTEMTMSEGNDALTPDMPRDLRYESDDKMVTLVWKAADPADGGVTGYELRYKKTSDAEYGSVMNLGMVMTYEVENLENGIEYTFEVKAVAASGNSMPTTVKATPAAPAPFMPMFNAGSTDPGDGTLYTLDFKNSAYFNGGLYPITIKLEEFGVPGSISSSAIAVQVTEGEENYTFNPATVTVDGKEIILTIPDVARTELEPNKRDFDKDSTFKVLIYQSAGVTNPTEKNTYGGAKPDEDREIFVEFGDSGAAKVFLSSIDVPRIVEIDPEDGGLGEMVTVTGKGFKNGTTLTVFLDLNRNGNIDSNEDVLCVDSAISSDDIGTCEFEVTHPAFEGGSNQMNYINAVDGRNGYVTKMDGKVFDLPMFELGASITASPASGKPGERILIQMLDFPKNVAVSKVEIGRVPLPTTDYSGGTDANGAGTFAITIPNNAKGGNQELRVTAGGKDASLNLDLQGPRVVSTPSEVRANQRISLVGTGFSPNSRIGDDVAGSISKISIGSHPIPWQDVNDGRDVNVDDGGNWSASVDLPVVEATTGGGERVIRITDSMGRRGTAIVTLAERSFDITPSSGRVGTLAVVRGTGYPSKNDDGYSFTIDVLYKVSNRSTTRVSVLPDASGRFEVQLRIPTSAAIPSSNQVEVSFSHQAGGSKVTDVKQHMVPEGALILSETSGGPGSTITLRGEGFKSFVPVGSVKIGNIEVTPTPRPSTDVNGMLEFDILIPGLEVGIQTIEVQVGQTTASVGFTVTESGIAAGAISPVAAAAEPLGENLDVVWHFNNDSKTWTFYDGGEGTTLTHMITGETYLILVKSSVEVILNRDTRSLTCVGGNCWNQIVW